MKIKPDQPDFCDAEQAVSKPGVMIQKQAAAGI